MKTWGEVQAYIRLHELPYTVIRFNMSLEGRLIDTVSGATLADTLMDAARLVKGE